MFLFSKDALNELKFTKTTRILQKVSISNKIQFLTFYPLKNPQKY